MSENGTITVTLPVTVTRGGDGFKVPGWPFRTRDQWARVSAMRTEGPERDIARAMVAYIDSLPENQPKDYGFLGALEVDGEEYDVVRIGGRGIIYATSRIDGEYFTFPSGLNWTDDWSKVLAAGTFTPRSDA